MDKDVIHNVAGQDAEITALRRENETLSQQVIKLIKAEGKLYEYQEELDAQLKEYKELYELSKKNNATLDIRKIFRQTGEYIIHNLEYERVVFLEQFDYGGSYTVCVVDGYYEQQEQAAIASLVIQENDPFLVPLREGREFLICQEGCVQKEFVEYRARLLMDEYLLYPLGSSQRPHVLMAVGNSAGNAEFYRRVRDGERELLGVGNLVGLLTSAVENYIFYTNMEAALEQERLAEAKYRGIFENATEGIFRTNIDGRILSCNPATATILGYDSTTDLVETIPNVTQLYVSPQRRRELYDLLRGKQDVKNFEVEIYCKDGSKRWVMMSTRAVFGEQGEILYVDGVLQDIAERKRAEKALLELNEELEQRVAERTRELETANDDLRQIARQLESAYLDLKSAQSQMLQQEKMASIGQLAAGVAHEINNPVGFVMSNLNSLRKYTEKLLAFIKSQDETIRDITGLTGERQMALLESLAAERKTLKIDYIAGDALSLIEESLEGTNRVKNIVQNLKSFSRIDEAENQPTDLNKAIESTLQIVWNEIKYKAKVIREYGEIPIIVCNSGELNQVFTNLLINAGQALLQAGEITIRTWSEGDSIFLAFSDTGTGIPPEIRQRIFEPFFTTKEVGKGTGLGLSITYDIIKKHQGDIEVTSEMGKGTTFTIRLPVKSGPADKKL
ncbi:MAG: PAS domain S-box protein [Proteobacteria bacterium]|nr:PAS domain S-box protein [Pseudomonadota bacterium]MBU4295925.1 PAS domain S-box protein [Pseudomonadota bacterium]MCG2746133.1 ATP-binding protein [Desulfobulbaceae bacterium]